MAEEIGRRIEASLRAAAEKRRAQAGGDFVLHPADRRRLQQEVSQKFHTMTSAASAGWLKGRITILTWGLATACVLAIAGWLVWDNEQRLTMTHLPAPEVAPSSTVGEDTRAVEAVRPATSPLTPAPQQTGRSDTLAPPGEQPNRARRGAAPQTAGAVPNGSMATPAELAASSTGSVAAKASPLGSSMSDAAFGATPSAAAPAVAVPDERSILRQPVFVAEEPLATLGGGPASTFYFASLQRSSEDQPLTQFSLTPTPDGSVKVVDGDGSIYTGRWQTASPAGLSPEATKAKSLPVRSLQVQRAATVRGGLAPQSDGAILYRFIVSGTNRGLDVPLTFEGVVLTAQSNYTATNVLNRAVIDATGASVSGKVRYPGGKEVRVEAGPLRK